MKEAPNHFACQVIQKSIICTKPTSGQLLSSCRIIQSDNLVVKCMKECAHHIDSKEGCSKSKGIIIVSHFQVVIDLGTDDVCL
jgi:hypothetical protein